MGALGGGSGPFGLNLGQMGGQGATTAVMGFPSIDRATGAIAGPASQLPTQPGKQRMGTSDFLRMMQAFQAGQRPGQDAAPLQPLNDQAVLNPLGGTLGNFLGGLM